MTTCATKKAPVTPPASFQRETLLSTMTQLARNTGFGLFLQHGPHWDSFGQEYLWARDEGLLELWPGVGGRGVTITDKGREWLRRQIRDGAGAVGGEGAGDVSL